MGIAGQYAKNVTAIISEVRMSRGRFFVLVEGSSDYRFLSRHVRDGVCVKNLQGRDAVVNATRILAGGPSKNFVGLVDADLQTVVARTEQMPRLVHVSLAEGEDESCIDLEACLIRTKALEKVCVEAFGDQVEREGGADAVANRIRAWLRETAAAIGAYRAAVMEHSLIGDRVASLGAFDDCSAQEWQRFANAAALTCDHLALEKLMREYVTPQSKFAALRQTAADYTAKCGSGWLLCRGHDMSRLLAMHFGAKRAEIHSKPEVERSLRMSFDREMLEQTAFGRKLLAYWT
jgi:hypothetical protein